MARAAGDPRRVTFHDLSGYADNVVYAADAPVYDTVIVDDMAAAIELAFEFGEGFQISMEPLS